MLRQPSRSGIVRGMQKSLVIVALALLQFGVAVGATDYYLKLDGVKGESAAAATTTSGTVQTRPSGASGGTEDMNIGIGELQETRTTGVEPDEIDANASAAGATGGSSGSGTTKGNVEYEWKVEEGEKGVPGVEPDEIDAAADGEPLTPDFSILLGSGSGDAAEREADAVADILMQGMQEAGAPAESISLNYEKIKAKVAQPAKLFGLIPIVLAAEVEIDAASQVKVKFPWWAFLASGKDGDSLGERVFTALSNVLKTKHDTIKNAIGNIR